ncbi:Phosphoenolpyruvate-protein phosphotransferase OS=Streptomyces glaucescens OX=1907 GN=ptsI PE=3 SV=1 [Streptomyces glaucescens]
MAADLMARGNLAGGEAQAVLEAQAMMAQDPELIADVDRRIAVGSTAERAVYDAFAAYRDLLAGAGEYLAGRVADLDDVRNRIVARLLGVPVAASSAVKRLRLDGVSGSRPFSAQ